MEDVLEVYQRQYADNEVLVCLDETSKQQVKDTRRPRPARPWGGGLLRLRIRAQRGEQPFHAVRSAGRMAPGGSDGPAHQKPIGPGWSGNWWTRTTRTRSVLSLVMDNLNTHHPSSLYEAFEPAEARRIAERLEIHYTPKHGSWLDMAEIEIGG